MKTNLFLLRQLAHSLGSVKKETGQFIRIMGNEVSQTEGLLYQGIFLSLHTLPLAKGSQMAMHILFIIINYLRYI